jgi:L-asparaginase/Glu-tRNA(Gln) amidotransferase subunit D
LCQQPTGVDGEFTCAPDWIRIASEIELNYDAFDAFVVMHGTDTMAYTASALSFLLEDLGKTVACAVGLSYIQPV